MENKENNKIATVVEAYEVENTLLTQMPNRLESGKVYFTNDKAFISTRINELFDMLKRGYEDKGGLIVKTPQKLLEDIDYIKLVFDSNNNILACMIYRTFAGGKKIYLGAAKRNIDGKAAMQEIIKTDIEPYDNFFWGEVSGPIEHYFKKHNGRPIPKELVSRFLGTKRHISISPDPNDPIYYTRMIGNIANPIEKALYGFKDEAMAREVMESIDNYEEFRLSTNALPDNLDESKEKDYLNNALDIVAELIEFHEEFQFNEMLPSWHKALANAISYMESNLSNIKLSKKEQVQSAIHHGKLLFKKMPLLKLQQFKA